MSKKTRVKSVKVKREKQPGELTRRRNPQIYRLQTATRFFQSKNWTEEQLREKAGNLVGRLLAINKVLGEEPHQRPIISESVLNALLTLYSQLTPDVREETYYRGRRGAEEGQDPGQPQQDEGDLRGAND